MNTNLVNAREQKWQAIITAQQKSGQTVQDFCQIQAISQSQYYYWRKKLSIQNVVSNISSNKHEFIELSARGEPSGWDIEIDLGHDVVLRFRRS